MQIKCSHHFNLEYNFLTPALKKTRDLASSFLTYSAAGSRFPCSRIVRTKLTRSKTVVYVPMFHLEHSISSYWVLLTSIKLPRTHYHGILCMVKAGQIYKKSIPILPWPKVWPQFVKKSGGLVRMIIANLVKPENLAPFRPPFYFIHTWFRAVKNGIF